MPPDMSQHGQQTGSSTSRAPCLHSVSDHDRLDGHRVYQNTNGHEAEYDHGDAKKQVVKAGLLSSIIFIWVDGNLFANP